MFGILKTKQGILILSIIWGLGISCLFKQVCRGRDCIVIKAPNPYKVQKGTYMHKGKCYNYVPYSTVCEGKTVKS